MPKHYIKITDKITLWCEVLGDLRNPRNPKILFIGGAGTHGISLWNEIFSQILFNLGYCIIRFDQRDTGQSTYIDFNRDPYKLSDMTNDAILLLKELIIDKIHIIASSLGGFIAQMIAIDHPELISSLTIIASTNNLLPVIKSVTENSEKTNKSSLNLLSPKQDVTKMLKACLESISNKECRQNQLTYEQISNKDKTQYLNTLQKIQSRPNNIRSGQNHLKAVLLDHINQTLNEEKLKKLKKIPVLIIHGTEDPLFPITHARHTQKLIKTSKLVKIHGMGHTITPEFFEKILTETTIHLFNAENKNYPILHCY